MERFNKKYILILLLTGIFFLTGCDKFSFSLFDASKEEDNQISVTVIPDDGQNGTDNSSPTGKAPASSSSAAATPTPKPPLTDIELSIYTVNEIPELEPVTVLVPQGNEITPELIVEKVVESLADQAIEIGIDYPVTTEGDAVVVSFQKDQAPYTNMGPEYEEDILNAFAQSLIDNLDTIKKVIFRIDGKAYTGGAFEYKIDEPYMSK